MNSEQKKYLNNYRISLITSGYLPNEADKEVKEVEQEIIDSNKKTKIFMYFLSVLSFFLLWSVSWKIGVGVYLFVWMNNVYKSMEG